MEFVGIGDLHLTSSTGRGGLSSYIKDHDNFVADLVINQPLKYAEKKGIQHIFLYGDLCEQTRMSYDAQLALIKILRNNQFKFHIILGNHDLFGEEPELGHSLQLIKELRLPHVTVYERPTDVILDKAPVRFLSWPHSKFSSKALNVAHVDVNGARSDSGRKFESDDLNSSDATAVVGHIHTNQRVRNTYFSGTLYQTNFGESPEKYFHHGICNGSDRTIENIPVKPVYRLHTFEVQNKSDLKQIPASDKDLIKLILLERNTLVASDYKHLNVVVVRPVKGAQDLAQARVEDLKSGTQIKFSTDDFFYEWLKGNSAPNDLKKLSLKIRKRILST